MATKIVIPDEDFSANAIYQDSDEPTPVQTTLVNGFASYAPGYIQIDGTNSSTMAIRVRTGELNGKYYVKVKAGYKIRGIIYYDATNNIDYSQAPIAAAAVTGGGTAVEASNNLTECTFNIANKKSCITFCKDDATAAISPSEDIIDELYYLDN